MYYLRTNYKGTSLSANEYNNYTKFTVIKVLTFAQL